MIWPVKSALTVALVLALAGCGVPDDGNNHGYGYEYDVRGESGLRLRYSPTLQASDPFSNVAYYERNFSEVEQCAHLSAPAPFLIIVPRGTFGYQGGSAVVGKYYHHPSLIVIDESIIGYRHEVIHYLLDYATGDSDHNHTSQIFLDKVCESEASGIGEG